MAQRLLVMRNETYCATTGLRLVSVLLSSEGVLGMFDVNTRSKLLERLRCG